MNQTKANTAPCPVCGFRLLAPLREFDICPSCGTEFGIDDIGHGYDELRGMWIENGAKWASGVDFPPKDWNPWLQLIQAGYNYSVPFIPSLKYRPQPVAEGGIQISKGIQFHIRTA